MDLLKNLLGRLSDSFFSSVPAGLRPRPRKRKSPSLKLVSDNPNPEPASEILHGRSTHSTVGHAESLEEALQRRETWLIRQQDPVEGFCCRSNQVSLRCKASSRDLRLSLLGTLMETLPVMSGPLMREDLW